MLYVFKHYGKGIHVHGEMTQPASSFLKTAITKPNDKPVKNSWGTESKYKGIWYASRAYVAYKTINLTLHKDAIPKAVRTKLGIR